MIRREPMTAGWERGGMYSLEIPTGEAPKRELLEFVLDAIFEDTLEPRSWKDWQGDGPLVTGAAALENVRIVSAIEKSARECVPVDIIRD
jgi:predicted dehydrogenase